MDITDCCVSIKVVVSQNGPYVTFFCNIPSEKINCFVKSSDSFILSIDFLACCYFINKHNVAK